MDDHRDDIERYLQGKMSPAERHDLERRALEDPFLADALEGAQTIPTGEFFTDLKDVRRRLAGGTSPQKKKYRHYAIAASILLLIGVASVLVLQSPNGAEKNVITLNREKPQSDEPASPGREESEPLPLQDSEIQKSEDQASPPRVESESNPPTADDDSEPKQSPITSGIDTSTEKDKRQSPAESQAILKESEQEEVTVTSPSFAARSQGLQLKSGDSTLRDTAADEQAAADRLAVNEGHRTGEKKRVTVAEPKSPAPAGASQNAVDMCTIEGTVTDAEDGLPLPGVSVLSADGTSGTITDINGRYDITVPADRTVVFSFVGMQSREVSVPAGQSAELDVQLMEDVSQLSEVVVTGYGNEDDIAMQNIRWEYAEPAGGRKAYKEYLEKNLRYPEKALESDIEGKVSVQFTIEPSGSLTEFRVVRSLGHGCDEEVMRLIKEGPTWSPTKRDDRPVKSKGRVKMRFALPKDKN
jgi:TonB family protein